MILHPTVVLHLPRAPRPRASTHAPRLRSTVVEGLVLDLPSGAVAGRRRAARILDVVVASLALVVLAPVMAVIAVVIACTSRGPILFRQVRLGLHCRPFVMLKFRTMYVDSDDRLHREYVRQLLEDPPTAPRGPDGLYKLVDDPRITPVGRWLRRASLDELPQLVNVLRGEMSLVGPRPALPWEATLFGPRHSARFQVSPGITGLWQISGRNRLTMTQALDLDVEYVERQCLRLDLAILIRTIPVVLGSKGAR
jgi:lipopolysaccharide/colanic/teichoic acid biosynthesis glycosyltransferase